MVNVDQEDMILPALKNTITIKDKLEKIDGKIKKNSLMMSMEQCVLLNINMIINQVIPQHKHQINQKNHLHLQQKPNQQLIVQDIVHKVVAKNQTAVKVRVNQNQNLNQNLRI